MMGNIKIGDKFGKLTIVEKADDYIYPNKKKRLKRWKCVCDCGNEAIVYERRLLSGKSIQCRSCSAQRKTSEIPKELIGYKFGKFTVIKQVDKPKHLKNKGNYCLCRCDCGNERIIKVADINRKHSLSCGECSKSIFDLSGEYGIGYTSKGEEFYFDLEDYELIKDYTWCTTTLGYIMAYIKGSQNEFVYMHRLILGLNNRDTYDVDHSNHKVFDNRKENLRICTHQENIMNSKLSKNNTSGVTGVRFDKNANKWNAYIMVNYNNINLGYYNNFNDAIKIRKEAEEKYFGEYSYKGE